MWCSFQGLPDRPYYHPSHSWEFCELADAFLIHFQLARCDFCCLKQKTFHLHFTLSSTCWAQLRNIDCPWIPVNDHYCGLERTARQMSKPVYSNRITSEDQAKECAQGFCTVEVLFFWSWQQSGPVQVYAMCELPCQTLHYKRSGWWGQQGNGCLALGVCIACLSLTIRFGELAWFGASGCPRSSVGFDLCPSLSAK